MSDELFGCAHDALIKGDFRAAIVSCNKVLQHAPDHANAWFLLGAAYHGSKQRAEAKKAFVNCCALDPQHLQARFALTALSIEIGDHETALLYACEAVQIAPDNPQAHTNLAIVQEAMQLCSEALASYDCALRIDPSFLDALKNRGVLLASQGKLEEAIANNEQFAALYPQRFDAHFNLGDTYLSAYRYAEATKAFSEALVLSPDHVPSLLQGGYALAVLENFDAAQKLLDRAIEIGSQKVRDFRRSMIGPEKKTPLKMCARELFLLNQYGKIEKCDWSMRQHFIDSFTDMIEENFPISDRALGFRALVMGIPAQSQLKLAQQISDAVIKNISSVKGIQKYRNALNPNRKLRIGYLSPDFRNHAMSMLAHALFAGHDRRFFEIFAYSLGKDESSPMRQRLKSYFEHFIDLEEFDDVRAAQRIANDHIDIMIDLAGHTTGSFPEILAHRPAPIQVAWLGYIATLGAPWIDYFVADPIIVPTEHEAGYSESILRMKNGLYLCSYANDKILPPPSRNDAGIPSSGLLLSAINGVYKIDPGIFALWMRILKAIPDATLWLFDSGKSASENLQKAALQHGVDISRLRFAPRMPHAEHLSRLQLVDLALDTPQCNGHTTTADALAAGIPVLTCMGALPAQRVAASMLRLCGLDELIVTNLEDYEKLALDLLCHPEKIYRLKQKLKDARATAPFFKPQEWVHEFEAGLQQVWRRHCAGLPPASMDVQCEPRCTSRRVTAIY